MTATPPDEARPFLIQALTDPWIAAPAAFMLSLLVLAVVMTVTNTKRWHARRHVARNVYDPMGCDHCLRDRNTYLDSLR